ncbi:hypothetical protein OE88DRAFT_1667677 [Heliocybe sulcata]|uniref:Uncharacterized protein n=1 Tax=Heliocybe sulcata TaxID=5364 RepID=A0A5C3MLS6_9AGAM|nr:hypothetical protein OE88DRAFT_1667677 [Heliocybe sulcata]
MGSKACKVCKKKKCRNKTHRTSKSNQDAPLSGQHNPPDEGNAVVYVTGILLPADAEEPRLVRVECKVTPNDEVPGQLDYYPDQSPFFGEKLTGCNQISSLAPHDYKSLPQHPFMVWYNDTFLLDGSPINRCIQTLTRNRAMHPWAGNVLVMKLYSSSMYEGKYMDADLEDLPTIRAYFTEYGRERSYGATRPSAETFLFQEFMRQASEPQVREPEAREPEVDEPRVYGPAYTYEQRRAPGTGWEGLWNVVAIAGGILVAIVFLVRALS